MEPLRLYLPEVAALVPLARALAVLLGPGELLLLQGPMGAGKTTCVKALAGALGGDPDAVTSPTFDLMRRYEDCRPPLLHVDAWRLEGLDQLLELGFEELCADALTCLEWPERVAGLAAPGSCWHLNLDHDLAGGRQALLSAPQGARLPQLPTQLLDGSIV